MRGLLCLLFLIGVVAVVEAQKSEHKKEKKNSKHTHSAVKKALKNSEHDLKEEAQSQVDAVRAKDSAVLARAEVQASHMQTDADHKMEKAEGELEDIAKAKKKEVKDQKHSDKDYHKDVKHWRETEVNTAKSVAKTEERADKLTHHMKTEERGQFAHYAHQQAQHAEANEVAEVQKEAVGEMKDAMWKQATRMEKDETEYNTFAANEKHEAKKLAKSAHKDYQKAHKLTKNVDHQVASQFKEEKHDIAVNKKDELSKIKHKFYKNVNRTTYTPAPFGDTTSSIGGYGAALAAVPTDISQNGAVLGMVALGSFMVAMAATVAIGRASRRNQDLEVRFVDSGSQADMEAGPSMYEPLPGQ